jgi:hypothetical protein
MKKIKYKKITYTLNNCAVNNKNIYVIIIRTYIKEIFKYINTCGICSNSYITITIIKDGKYCEECKSNICLNFDCTKFHKSNKKISKSMPKIKTTPIDYVDFLYRGGSIIELNKMMDNEVC